MQYNIYLFCVSMPSLRVVLSFFQFSSRTLLLYFFAVLLEGGTCLLKVDFGSVDLGWGFEAVKEVLGPVHVGTGGGFVVLHYAVGSE